MRAERPLQFRRQEELVKYLALVIAVLVGATTAAGQTPAVHTDASQPTQSPVFRSGASLVAFNVTVMDGKQFVEGLQSADFVVFEDGVKQDVRFFEATSIPLDLVLLIDTSSSMRDKMPVVQEAALGFLKTLRVADRGSVIEFNDGVNVVETLTSDRAALEAAVRKTNAKGGTALNNALYIALKQFGKMRSSAGEVRRQAIAVLSDGNDTVSLVSFDDVLGQARRSGVNIYTIALKSQYQNQAVGGNFSESDYAMRTLARETGAQSFFPAQINELKGIYSTIGQELFRQYSIGYSPTNVRMDGAFRRIVVHVTSRPELKLRARSGYLAEGSPVAARRAPDVR
jgi:Ca-activated chloride channel family protein